MKTIDIEIMVANHFDFRQSLIVPNISWGINIHECDLLVVTKSNYLIEVEIKVSKADLIKDLLKWHKHEDKRLKALYFAIPLELLKYQNYIPSRAGILTVENREARNIDNSIYKYMRINLEKKPQINKLTQPISEEERYNIARLATMRVWTLKKRIRNLSK